MQYLVEPIPFTSSSAPPLAQQRVYAIVAAQGGLVLQAPEQSGGAVTLAKWNESARQRWRTEANGDGTFRIVNVATGHVLDVPGINTAPGVGIIAWSWNGSNNQRWKLETTGNSWIRLRAAHSGLLLHAGAGESGMQVTQATDDGAAGEIVAYRDTNYTGTSQKFGIGRWDLRAMNKVGNDTISSLRVPKGLRVTLFEHDNFKGSSKTYAADSAFTLDQEFNDKASSLIVQAESQVSATKVTIYTDAQYAGASRQLGVGVYNGQYLSAFGFSRAISSLKVPPGKRVILFAEGTFTGLSRTYTADTAWVDEFNDLAVSMIVEDVSSGIGQHWQLALVRTLDEALSLQLDPRVRLYTGASYSGDVQELGIGAWKAEDLTIGVDKLSSLEFRWPPFIRVSLYDNDKFSGLIAIVESGSSGWLGAEVDNKTASLRIDQVARFDATDNFNPNDLRTFDWCLPPGRYTRAQFYKGRIDGKIDKVRVPPQLRVILYDQDNFTGNERVIVEDTVLDDAFRDKVASVVILRRGVVVSPHTVKYGDRLQFVTGSGRLASVPLADGTRVNTFVIGCAGPAKLASQVSYGDIVSLQAGTGSVTLYRDPNYGGTSQKLGVGRWLIADLTLNDNISSLKVPAGMKVTLYEHSSLNGISREFTADAPTLPAEIDNRTSSLIVEQIFEGAVYLNVAPDGSITASAPITSAPVASQQFRVFLSGPSSQGTLLTHGDTFSLESLSRTRLVTASSTGQLTATATTIGSNERMVVRDLRALANAAEGGDGSGPCSAELCGQQICGTAATGVGICGADACGADVCGLDACGVAICTADGTLAGLCAVAASGLALCGADVCGAAVCGADMCGAAANGVAACGAAACGAAACGADACGVAASPIEVCGAAASLIDVCPADACAAAACAVNVCPINACAADACGLNIIPIVPGI